MKEGTLLSFVISLEGTTIDLGSIEPIKAITFPQNKKTMQSFLEKINFVRRFISDFTKIVKPLQEMIKNILISRGQRKEGKHLKRSKKP